MYMSVTVNVSVSVSGQMCMDGLRVMHPNEKYGKGGHYVGDVKVSKIWQAGLW